MSTPNSPHVPMNAPTSNHPKRKRLLWVLAVVFLLTAVFYGARWWLHGRHHVSTDDAYVAGNLVRVTPRIAGTVTEVRVDNTDHVRRGQVLVRLDDTDARLALERAEADLASAVRQISQRFENRRQQQANLAVRQNALEQAEADWRRREQAVSVQAVSKEEAEHAKAARDQARAALELARAQLSAAEVDVADTTVATHPAVRQAAARFRAAWLDLERCVIRAAEDGQIEKRSVQIGQQIAPGAALMALVPLHQLWVEANYKEDQLRGMKIGQPVELVSDLYGDDTVFHGRITGISPGTGSVFSLLPAQNASGNWIKIIQRLPVRIALEAAELEKYPLRVGLSMRTEVNIAAEGQAEPARQKGAASPGAGEKADPASREEGLTPEAESRSVDEFKAANERIRRIIQANLPRPAGKPA